MTNTQIGVLALALALYGVIRLALDTYRVIRAILRGLARAVGWIADRARAWSFARERRRVKREEGIGALNAEALRDVAAALTDARAELARARASASVDHDPGQAMIPGLITAENCMRGAA